MMLIILNELIAKYTFPIFKGNSDNSLDIFEDIIIQDGSSLSLHKSLKDIYPGRFSKNAPAAVELHLTLSIFTQSIKSLTLSPDTTSERKYLPEPKELKNKLLLADRGYLKFSYFQDVTDEGGSFIIRIRKVSSLQVVGTKYKIKEYISQLGGKDFDVTVQKKDKTGRKIRFRVLGLKNPNTKNYWLLATNIDKTKFPAKIVQKLYHYRWQIELIFKQWKSYANLKKFNTRKENIAIGLIWASLISHVLISFIGNVIRARNPPLKMTLLNIAKLSHIFIHDLLKLLKEGKIKYLIQQIEKIESYLCTHAVRKNLKRDQTVGALNLNLEVII